MLFDTDIFIWIQRGNRKAARLIDRTRERYISIYSYMELVQTAQNSQQLHYINDFISSMGFVVLPLTEDVGHRALIYTEVYTISGGLRAGDALIAATAAENHLTLVTGDKKHFKQFKDVNLKIFYP